MKKIWIVLIAAILLRLFLAFATFHPDIQALSDSGKFISRGFIFNLYDQSSQSLVLNYPPLIYWYFGLFNLFLNGNIPLLKLSYLIFDLTLAFLLYKFVGSGKSTLALSLWLFNPINLYATYMIGQFDIIPTLFTFLSLYLIHKNKLTPAAIALGMGIAFKLYPVFVVIPLIILVKGYLEKVKLLILSSLPYLLSILIYIPSASFRHNALFASQSSKSLYAEIPLSGGESILLFPLSVLLFYLFIWNKKADKLSYWKIYLIPLLLFFSFTHFHPQWLIWVVPFLFLDLVEEKFKNLLQVLIIFGSWFASLFFFDSSLTLGIFSPLISTPHYMPSIWDILNLNPDYNFSRSVLQTIFSAASFYLIYQYFPKKNNEV